MFAWLDAFKLHRQVPPCPYGCLPDLPLKEVPFPTSLIKNVDMSYLFAVHLDQVRASHHGCLQLPQFHWLCLVVQWA